MGECYICVNDTKRCFFFIDPTMTEIKRSFVGRNIGSRIFSLLLLENNGDYTGLADRPLIGSWIGDSFYLTADDYARRFSVSKTDYKNVGQEVLELVAIANPFDLIRFGGRDWTVDLIEKGSKHVRVTENMAVRMLEVFGDEHARFPSEHLEKITSALKRMVGD